MTTEEAAKILLEFGDGTYERPNTGYGGPNILECTCCHGLLNCYEASHKPDCLLQEARETIKKLK